MKTVKASIMHKCPECGKEYEITKLCLGKREARKWEKEASRYSNYLCRECYAHTGLYKINNAFRAAVEEYGLSLPYLVGTPKQIKWASNLRKVFVLKMAIEGRLENMDEVDVLDKNDAGWWIDNRNILYIPQYGEDFADAYIKQWRISHGVAEMEYYI